MTDIKTIATELKAAAQNPAHFGDTTDGGHRRYCMVECGKLERIADAVLAGPEWHDKPTGEGLWLPDGLKASCVEERDGVISFAGRFARIPFLSISDSWFGPIPARGDG